MNKYNSNDYNKTSSFLRLVDTMKRAKENHRPFTLFIGAGCSLSSSIKPINTESLLLRCLQDHFDKNYQMPNSWHQLYQDFINYIWSNNGVEERREMLADYFKGLKPGIGYQNLKLLVEKGYITQIITTNFDVLINESLQGISYKLKVGESPVRSILGGSPVFVCKVHGDIEHGELRFSPDELSILPENISNTIKSLTKDSCLFCGYRGQDFGVMNSVCQDSGHSIFWAAPIKPIEGDYSESKLIYKIVESRNSRGNFIYGRTLGDFDKLMTQLVRELLNTDPILVLPAIWNKSVFGHILSINPKVLQMFEKLLYKSNELKDNYHTQSKSPFFTVNYNTVLEAFLFYYDIKGSTPSLLQIPENEVEALLVGLAIEILARTASCDVKPIEYAQKLRQVYEETTPAYQPDDTFWSALYIILDSCQSHLDLKSEIVQICLIMNNNGRLTFNVKNPQLENISNILSILNICGLFLPTSEEDTSSDIRYKCKKLLESRSHQEKVSDNNIIFKVDSVTKEEFIDIYHSFFEDLNANLDETGKIIFNSIIIEANFKEKISEYIPASNISEYIINVAKQMTHEFQMLHSAFELEQGIYVSTPLEQELNSFVMSGQLGMFIVGSSGSGKTKSLQHFINISTDEFIIAATAPKCGRMDSYSGINIFFNELKSKNTNEVKHFVENINFLLKNLNKTLILVIDGINELTGGFENCVLHYKTIIKNLDSFSDWEITNIKIITTCRDFAFLDYCRHTGLYPSARNCYYQTRGDSIKTYYQILPLSLELQIKFCEAYITNKESRELFIQDLKNNKYIQQTFTSPYLIAIIGNRYKHNNLKKTNLHIHDIFSEFTKQMLKRLNNYEDQSIAYQIIYTYFELVLSQVQYIKHLTPFVLLRNIPNNVRTVYVLNQLRDLNLLIDVENSEYIRFSHDRIEEYFLTEFLFNNSDNPKIMRNVLKLASHESIYWFGLQNYIKCSMEKGYYEQVLCNIELWYNDDNELLPLLFMSGFETLQKKQIINFLYIAKNECQLFDLLLSLFHIGLKKALNNSNLRYPTEFIEMIEQLSVLFQEFKHYKAYYYYMTSRYYFNIKNNQTLSLSYCNKAIENSDNNEILKYLIELQNTIIKKRNGEFDNIFDGFLKIYNFFSMHNEWEYATECVLEWGSALRQKTCFKEALVVYEKINPDNIKKHPELLATLHRKKGTIYKNILQNILREKREKTLSESDIIEIRDYYDCAMEEYSFAISALKSVNDVPEMITILSEQTEATLKLALIIPEMRALADIYNSEEAKLLSYLPIPDRMVVYLRELAIMAEQDGKYSVAIEKLLAAKEYSIKYSLSFRTFEVNYQLGRLTNRTWKYLDSKQREIGMCALDEAIQYPLEEENQYHKICVKTKKEICQRLSEL